MSKQNKSLLVNGCSFTAKSNNPSWADYVSFSNKNIAQHGAGNRWICDSTMTELLYKEYDMVLVMWSGLTRIDEIIDEETFNEFWYFKSKNNLGIQYGHCGIGDAPDSPMSDIVKPKIAFNDIKGMVFDSLLSMIKLQEFLKTRNQKYRFMSFMNYWNESYIENNITQPSVKGLDLDSLVDKIDFKNWIFKNNKKDGIFELAREKNLFQEDGVHPNDEANKEWAKIINEQTK